MISLCTKWDPFKPFQFSEVVFLAGVAFGSLSEKWGAFRDLGSMPKDPGEADINLKQLERKQKSEWSLKEKITSSTVLRLSMVKLVRFGLFRNRGFRKNQWGFFTFDFNIQPNSDPMSQHFLSHKKLHTIPTTALVLPFFQKEAANGGRPGDGESLQVGRKEGGWLGSSVAKKQPKMGPKEGAKLGGVLLFENLGLLISFFMIWIKIWNRLGVSLAPFRCLFCCLQLPRPRTLCRRRHNRWAKATYLFVGNTDI